MRCSDAIQCRWKGRTRISDRSLEEEVFTFLFAGYVLDGVVLCCSLPFIRLQLVNCFTTEESLIGWGCHLAAKLSDPAAPLDH